MDEQPRFAERCERMRKLASYLKDTQDFKTSADPAILMTLATSPKGAMRSKLGKSIAFGGLVIAFVVVVIGLAVALRGLKGGDDRIVMATGNAQYHALAETYRDDLLRNGVSLELRDTTEGFATLQALVDDKSGITAGFVKGGLGSVLNRGFR